MAEWTHRCCERCWFDGSKGFTASDGLYEVKAPGQMADGGFKLPVQVKDLEPGVCCFCGGLTITGIFTRHDQEELLCKGRHDPEDLGEWARVALGSGAGSGAMDTGTPALPSPGTSETGTGASSFATE